MINTHLQIPLLPYQDQQRLIQYTETNTTTLNSLLCSYSFPLHNSKFKILKLMIITKFPVAIGCNRLVVRVQTWTQESSPVLPESDLLIRELDLDSQSATLKLSPCSKSLCIVCPSIKCTS